MEMANILLKNLRDIKTTQVHKKPLTPSGPTTSSSVSTLPQYQPPAPERPPRPQPPSLHIPQITTTPPNQYGAPAPQPPQQQYQQPPYPQQQQQQGYESGVRPGQRMPQQPPPASHRLSFDPNRPQDGYSQVGSTLTSLITLDATHAKASQNLTSTSAC